MVNAPNRLNRDDAVGAQLQGSNVDLGLEMKGLVADVLSTPGTGPPDFLDCGVGLQLRC